MTRRTMALLVAATALCGGAAVVAASPTDKPLTAASVLHLPKAEAFGAALGAVVSVNVAGRMRSKRPRSGGGGGSDRG